MRVEKTNFVYFDVVQRLNHFYIFFFFFAEFVTFFLNVW